MDVQELKDLLRDIESDLVERKASLSERDKIRQAICAFANDLPNHNAVLHRTYEGTNAPARITWFSDRIEIQNPGGPFGQVTRQNFSQPGITDYRNPHLAEAMKNLGYVQRFGIGIEMARKELEKNGNPPLEFVIEDAHVLVIVRRGN
jgi:predicted HTH transcriptional regulator